MISATEGECIDRSTVSTREVPSPDLVNAELNVTGVSVADDWTSITFLRDLSSLDDEDYNLKEVRDVLFLFFSFFLRHYILLPGVFFRFCFVHVSSCFW